MIFDFTDPIGAIQTIFSILVLVELIQFLDKDDMGAHIQERVAFYSGIINKVLGFLKLAGSGFAIIGKRLFSRKEKDPQPDMKKDFGEVYQMDEDEKEDPFEGEGGIDG